MPARFYTDAHIASAVATQLRGRGVDIVRCQEVGLSDAKDFQHLEYATSQNRAIVTNDRDFELLHAQYLSEGKRHAGIIRVTKNKDDIGMIVQALLFLHEAVESGAADVEKDIYNQLFHLPEK